MIILKGEGSKKIFLFKHLEQRLLLNLSDVELSSIRNKENLIGVYFGGPMQLLDNRVDFIFGRSKNILNINTINLPHINLTGADFVFSNVNHVQQRDIIGIFNSSSLKRHMYFLDIAAHFPNTALYTYGLPSGVKRLVRTMQKSRNRIRTEIFFGIEEIRNEIFPWNSETIGEALKTAKSFLLTSKSEGVNRAAVFAGRLGVPVFIASDCNGDTYEYLKEIGCEVHLFSTVEEAVVKIQNVIHSDIDGIGINYNDKPVRKFKAFLHDEFGFETNLDALRISNAERIIASHGNTLEGKYSGRDDMFTSLIELRKFFGLKLTLRVLWHTVLNGIKNIFVVLLKLSKRMLCLF